jgi:hypothetical protein
MRFIGNAPVDGEVRAIASGALATGDTVVVNSDGTVSAVAGQSLGSGSPVTYEAATTIITAATFDSNANKVVIVYRDGGNSNYGTAVVGTVSGTSISFGTPVVFSASVTSNHAVTFDSANAKIVITYEDNGNNEYGTAIVGTVSGTSISFGTAVVYESAQTQQQSCVFDSNSGKVVFAYRDQGNSNYGTAIVGTVSGTSITFGSATVFNTGITNYIDSVFDSSSNKVVLVYQDASNSAYGTAIVGTVSGTSISFGSESVYETSGVYYNSVSFDSTNNKVVVGYQDSGNGSYGTAAVGTVSGTSISFGTPVVFQSSNSDWVECVYDSSANKTNIFFRDNTSVPYPLTQTVGTVSGTSISFTTPALLENTNASYIATTFDSNLNKIVIAYRDESNSYHGKAIVFQNESTNLTSENFVGFANSGYADGQSAAINSTCMVDSNQTSLTAGQTYYVQTSGALGTTPASPSVVAGTAISSKSIIVKG